jgi:hypothetical protein
VMSQDMGDGWDFLRPRDMWTDVVASASSQASHHEELQENQINHPRRNAVACPP